MQYNKKLDKFFSQLREKGREEQEEQLQEEIWSGQKLGIIILALSYIAYKCFGYLIPDFNLSSLWLKTTNIQESVLSYWYLPAWGIVLSTIVGNSSKNGMAFKVLTRTIAGIWEEIGYRGLFIFTSMAILIISNFLFTWLLVILVIILVFACLIHVGGDGWIIKLALVVGIVIPICYWIVTSDFGNNPVFWIYENIWFPIWHYASFGTLDSILYNKEYSLLFIMGSMSANLKFRNGHAYQGWLGYINSWVIGYILLHAMMFHGIVVAIILHILYNLAVSVVEYIKPTHEGITKKNTTKEAAVLSGSFLTFIKKA